MAVNSRVSLIKGFIRFLGGLEAQVKTVRLHSQGKLKGEDWKFGSFAGLGASVILCRSYGALVRGVSDFL
jgi:hypothetical protein